MALFKPGFRSCNPWKREAQSFRSEVDGFVPLSRYRSAVLRRDVEFHRNDLTKVKMMLKLQSRTPSLLQDCTSLPARFGLTAESGINGEQWGGEKTKGMEKKDALGLSRRAPIEFSNCLSIKQEGKASLMLRAEPVREIVL